MKHSDYVKIRSVNPSYLIISKVDGDIGEQNGSKYLVFDSAELHSRDKSKKVFKKIH